MQIRMTAVANVHLLIVQRTRELDFFQPQVQNPIAKKKLLKQNQQFTIPILLPALGLCEGIVENT